jgi:hypothetical protein
VTSVSLAELHRKSGHLSASDLETWLRRSGLWKAEWSDALADVCNSCSCVEASRPKHHPATSQSQMKRPCELGEDLCVDIIFLRGFPILHAVDRYSTFSVTRVLSSRKSPELVHALDVIVDEFGRTARHAVRFRRMLCDQEFRKSPQVVEWTKSKGIAMRDVSTEGHSQNGSIEAANRVLRMFFERLFLANGSDDGLIEAMVATSTRSKNACIGNKAASAVEIWTGSVPKFAHDLLGFDSGVSLPAELIQAFEARKARTALAKTLKRPEYPEERVKIGDFVRFYRERDKIWKGPVRVVSVDNNRVNFVYQGSQSSAARVAVRKVLPPFSTLIDPDMIEEELAHEVRLSSTDPLPMSQLSEQSHSVGHDMEPCDDPADAVSVPDGNYGRDTEDGPDDIDVRNEQQETISAADSAESPVQDGDNDPKVLRSGVHYFSTSFFFKDSRSHATAATVSRVRHAFRLHQPYATEKEKEAAYMQERANWETNKAMTIVPKSKVPPWANVLKSSVIYRWKDESTLKARIVPDGRGDSEKDFLRTDSPTMAVDIFRLLVSVAAERGWTLASLDIKAAYLQAEDYDRLVFVKPPKEEEDDANLWLLMAAAYGLVDSGRLWYLTSSKALRQFGLSCSSLDSCTWTLKKDNGICLIVLVQTDNYLYTGLPGHIARFEQFMSQKFKVGSIEHDVFKVYGMSITPHDGGFVIDQNDKKVDLELYPHSLLHCRAGEYAASEREHRFVMSTIGSLLFIGRVSCPPLLHTASHFASRLKSLKVRHVKELNSRLKLAHMMDFSLRFAKPPVGHVAALVAFSDASHYRDRVDDSRIGMLVFRSWGIGAGSVCHALDFAAHKLRRVAVSSKGAETQAAVKALGAMRFLSALSLQIVASSLEITLVVDSLGLRDSVVGHSRQSDGSVMIDVACLRESYHNHELRIAWCPTRDMLADPCTKSGADCAQLMRVLNVGRWVTTIADVRQSSVELPCRDPGVW